MTSGRLDEFPLVNQHPEYSKYQADWKIKRKGSKDYEAVRFYESIYERLGYL